MKHGWGRLHPACLCLLSITPTGQKPREMGEEMEQKAKTPSQAAQASALALPLPNGAPWEKHRPPQTCFPMETQRESFRSGCPPASCGSHLSLQICHYQMVRGMPTSQGFLYTHTGWVHGEDPPEAFLALDTCPFRPAYTGQSERTGLVHLLSHQPLNAHTLHNCKNPAIPESTWLGDLAAVLATDSL